VKILLPVEAAGPVTLKAVSQGCWDGGICYPPINQEAQLDLAAPEEVRHLRQRPERPSPTQRRLSLPASAAAPADESSRIAGLFKGDNLAWCWPASSASACCCRSRPASSR
jgi:thiol:disulfide interchange protein DsbD